LAGVSFIISTFTLLDCSPWQQQWAKHQGGYGGSAAADRRRLHHHFGLTTRDKVGEEEFE
jgi:hypothetical protein